MKIIEIQRFNQAGILLRIKSPHLVNFFDRFKAELQAKGLRLPPAEPPSEGYCTGWAGLLSRAEALPGSMVEAVLAMEEQVTPENWPRLEAAVRNARYSGLWLDTASSRESLALQLWLWCPYRLGDDLKPVQEKIETGKRLWDEHQKVENESQRKLMPEIPSTPQPSPLTLLPSDGRGESKREPVKRTGVILPAVMIDSDAALATYFMKHQIHWIQAEDAIHSQGKQVFALAEKSVRIGWTYADSFKNVRKRLRFKDRDYLFATKDYHSALEYVRLARKFAESFNFTKAIVAHGEDYLKVSRLDQDGKPTGFMDEIKMGYIKFDNGSCIRAFSSHPQAMAVYGGDVGLDEFAKHPNARVLWETAQGRMTWAYDMAVWSAHDGEDTLFYQFAQEAQGGKGPWNLYYRVTMIDAIEMGLVDVINRVRGTSLTAGQFLADCKSRSRLEEVYQQTYLCNPAPSAAGIVEWSAIEHCRSDYKIERLHLEAEDIRKQFGEFRPEYQFARAEKIRDFIHRRFLPLFQNYKGHNYRMGFDVAASGEGDLTVIYIDDKKGAELWLQALFTCRTEDWDFIKTVLFTFMQELRYMQGAGDETGLGRQICWEAAKAFRGRFTSVNFSSRKHDIGFALMNQLSVAEKRFPRSEQDIAADYFALRKTFHGSKWIFSEGSNTLNPASHCDIAWAGGLATEANNFPAHCVGAQVG